MKGCAKIREQLSAYVDQALSPEEIKAVDEHVAKCASCAAALADMRKVVAHLQALEQVEPPAWFTQKVMVRVRELQGSGEKTGFFSWLTQPMNFKIPIGAVATAMLAVTTYFVIHNIVPDMPEERTAQVAETPAAAPTQATQKAQVNEKAKKDVLRGHVESKEKAVVKSTQYLDRGVKSERPSQEEQTNALPQAKGGYAPAPSINHKSSVPASAPSRASDLKAGAASPSEPADRYQEKAGASRAKKAMPSRGYSTDASDRSMAKSAERPYEESQYQTSQLAKPSMVEGVPVSLHMSAPDPMVAGNKVADALRQFRGQDIKVESKGARVIVKGLLQVQWLQPFYEKLKAIGQVHEKTAPAFADVGSVKITVEIAAPN